MNLTGDRPLTKRDAKLLASWWNQHTSGVFIIELDHGSRKTHRLYHVIKQ